MAGLLRKKDLLCDACCCLFSSLRSLIFLRNSINPALRMRQHTKRKSVPQGLSGALFSPVQPLLRVLFSLTLPGRLLDLLDNSSSFFSCYQR